MTRNSQAERLLVKRLREADGTAVAQLASAYGQKIFQLAFRYLKNREDAEELTQDVLLKVFSKIRSFRGDAALSSWVYRITFNAAMSRLRNGRFARPAGVPEIALVGPSADRVPRWHEVADWTAMADEALLRRQLRERLATAIHELPPIYRVPIILRDIQGLSTEEASARLRVKAQTFKSRLHRGRLYLRERLADFGDGLTMHHAA